MAYKALYRVYRPQDFNEVAGQEHITKTFKNALKNDKLAHAYLFCGPRGTGKTSIAKIIAKAVNCVNAPSENPCNVCPNCLEITNGMATDVIEIDAASNNGVDEIREIREKVKFLPSMGRYKVYIIDEVHMLSIGAFNALLKTLEEPPRHVIFILATTEPHKIPSTIHSRCQRFDFRGISKDEIIDRMKVVITEENLQVEESALEVIAEVAEGGMRDALTLLDQAVSFANDKVTVEDVNAVTGTVSDKSMITITNAIINKDTVETLNIYEAMLKEGKETPRIIANMISFYRDLLMYKTAPSNDKYLFTQESFLDIVSKVNKGFIYQAIETLNESQSNMRRSVNKKVVMELALIKLSSSKQELEPQSVQTNVKVDLANNEDIKGLQTKFDSIEARLEKMLSKFRQVLKTSAVETKTFDVNFVQQVLVNGDKQRKEKLVTNWNKLSETKDIAQLGLAKLLLQTEVVAYSSNREMVLVTKDVSLCNKLMEDEVRKDAKELFNEIFKAPFTYIVLPREVWEEKRDEFAAKWKQGDKNPTLSPIIFEGLIDREETKEEEAEIIRLAKELFASELLEIIK